MFYLHSHTLKMDCEQYRRHLKKKKRLLKHLQKLKSEKWQKLKT